MPFQEARSVMSTQKLRPDTLSGMSSASSLTTYSNTRDIDLVALLATLWRFRWRILIAVAGSALAGLLLTFFLPQKWTSQARVTPVELSQQYELDTLIGQVKAHDVNIPLTRKDVFVLFIKKFQSPSLVEKYLKDMPALQTRLSEDGEGKAARYRAVVMMGENMKAADDAAGKKAVELLWPSWTLSFTAPSAGEARQVLAGYIRFITARVQTQVLDEIRDAVALKARSEKESLELQQGALQNEHQTRIKRLEYGLEVARAAGLKVPVYSKGQAVKDDPDFSVSLGADGIARKLQIEQSVRDMGELNADFRTRQVRQQQLEALSASVPSVMTFPVVNWQREPSLPLKRDGAGRALIVLLAAMLGGFIACGGILLREATGQQRKIIHWC